MPLVIAHVVRSLEVGGLENGVVSVANAAAPDVRQVIICLRTPGALRGRLRADVDVIALGQADRHDFTLFTRLVRVLRRMRPDIVHCRNWPTFDAIPAARLAVVPFVVYSEHGRDITDPDGRNPKRNRLRKIFAPLVNRIVTVSDDLRRWLIEDVRIPVHKVITIRNGVDVNRFTPGDQAAARRALGLDPDRAVVGTVGRLDPVKDQAGLLRAFARVRARYPGALLLIAGDGPCRPDLITLTHSLGLAEHVRLLGERHDIPVVLQAMDVFVLPSIAEGISNTVLEAMATGLPIVATRVGGNPELVEDGIHGMLTAREHPEALVDAIHAYLGDPQRRAAHGESARRRAVHCFSLERMTGSYLGLYRDLAARRLVGRA